jgi:hypothetical protein
MAIKKNFAGIDSDVSSFLSQKEETAVSDTVGENTKNERLSLYVPSEMMEQIKLIAGATKCSKNKFVIDLIGKSLQNPQYQKIYEAMKEINKNINI